MTSNFFKRIFIVLAVVATLFSCKTEEKKAKYVFYFIGDGMGFSHIALTEAYLSAKDGGLGSEPLVFTQFPVMGMATSYSASNNITCSSAAGTALASGYKTNNGMLGVAPDTSDITSIAVKIHDAGIPVGIMSTVTIDHATPAAFYGHSAKRSDYYGISKQLAESGFEFFGGGGFEGAKDKKNEDKNIYDIVAENGYVLAYGMEDYKNKKASTDKIILFQEGDKANQILPFVYDRKEGDMTLPIVVEAAIDFLNSKEGFFIMAEGGKIDWAAHGNDVAGTIFETLDMDEAIAVAYEFYKQHPDETLIVVTADHETGGVALGRTKGYTFDLTIVPEPTMTNATDHEVSVENYMSEAAKDSLSVAARIGWTTGSHTAGAVPVFAIGTGSEAFAGRMDNTDIPKKICAAMGIKY